MKFYLGLLCLSILSVSGHAKLISLPSDATLEACARAQLKAAITDSKFPNITIQNLVPKSDFFGRVTHYKAYGSLDGHPVKGYVYPVTRVWWDLNAAGLREYSQKCTLARSLICADRLKLRNQTKDILVRMMGECSGSEE